MALRRLCAGLAIATCVLGGGRMLLGCDFFFSNANPYAWEESGAGAGHHAGGAGAGGDASGGGVNPNCGNGVIDPGETCDPPASCPQSCDDGNSCTADPATGSAANCNIACDHTVIDTCVNADGCCPAGCSGSNDNDCSLT